MSDLSSRFVLALESAVAGGSIALFENGAEIDRIVGEANISRAEDLLPNIVKLLQNNNIDGAALSQIVVGAGPGSFTGVRIGMATALGLSTAFGIHLRRLSTLEAISFIAAEDHVIAALPVGRDTICLQSFGRREDRYLAVSDPEAISQLDFLELVHLDPAGIIVVNGSIFESVPPDCHSNLLNAGEDLAGHLGRAALETEIADVAGPLFIGKRK